MTCSLRSEGHRLTWHCRAGEEFSLGHLLVLPVMVVLVLCLHVDLCGVGSVR